MKTLYLLRHAHAITAPPPGLGDHERVLSPQGNEDAQAVGRFMTEHDLYPQLIFSSSSIRTTQTARHVHGILSAASGLTINSHFDRNLYQAPAEKILETIHETDDVIQSLMIVAHNPGIAEFALALGGKKFPPELYHYVPATLSVFKTDSKNWSDISPDNVTLEKIFAPEV